jgi:hypothetical protein
VAILPLKFIRNETTNSIEEFGYYLQERAIEDYRKSAAELKFPNAAETNAILLKKGIDYSMIRQYTPKELASILGVEYLIMGNVVQDGTNIRTETNKDASARKTTYNKNEDYERKDRYNVRSSSTTTQHYETEVSLTIFNATGANVYSKSRHSILSDKDAYKNALHYLLKRTPLYKR